MSTHRRICFTFNVPDIHLDVDWNALITGWDLVVYGVWQAEIAPTTGRRHLQGYLEFKRPVSLSVIKKRLGNMHVEKPVADNATNTRYCTKDETRAPGDSGPWRVDRRPLNLGGVPAAQGSRSDLVQFRDAILNGLDDAGLLDAYPSQFFRYATMVPRIRAIGSPRRDWAPEVHIYFGDAGTGKSRRAHELAPRAYRKVSGMWWDLYSGEPDVIMDDFYGPDDLSYTEFLKLTDRYDYLAQVKGGMARINPRRIFITSNKHPRDWYVGQNGYMAKAFFRRVEKILMFRGDEVTDLPPAMFFDD